MGHMRKTDEAFNFQAEQDVLKATHTFNMSGKGCVSAQNSLVDPALSTAGSFVVNGEFATVAASSSFFTLEDTLVPAYGAVNFVLAVNAAGTGVGYATNVMDSEQVSAAVSDPAQSAATVPLTVRDADAIVWPAIPATMCPVGIYTVVAGAVSHVSGSSSFSLVDSAAGSHLFTDIATLNRAS